MATLITEKEMERIKELKSSCSFLQRFVLWWRYRNMKALDKDLTLKDLTLAELAKSSRNNLPSDFADIMQKENQILKDLDDFRKIARYSKSIKKTR